MKKIISLLLAVVMVFGIVPMGAFVSSAADDAIVPYDQPVKILIYRNGDTQNVYRSYSLSGYDKGDVIYASDIDLSVYYSWENGYKAEGPFNDGGWNNYKKNGKATPFEKITVNGWTNICYMVTDYEKVSAKAVYNSDVAGAETVVSSLVLYGTNLADFLGTDAEFSEKVAEKAGYTLDKWFDSDALSTKVDESAVVTEDTTVYATYTANAYTLTLTDPLNETEDTKAVTFAEAVGELPTPRQRLGYTFLGWFDETTGEQYTEDTVYNATDDVTLTANWNINSGKTYGKLKLTVEEIVYYTGKLPTAKWPHKVAVKLANVCLKMIKVMEDVKIINFQGIKDALYNLAADLLANAITEYWVDHDRV